MLILLLTGFQERSFPYKYLGTSLFDSIVCNGSWVEMMDKMKKKSMNWTFCPLNLESILELVKSVLQTMSIYLFSTMEAPKVILKEIKNLQWKFLWSGLSDKHKWALVKWDEV